MRTPVSPGDEVALGFRLLSEHSRDIVYRYRLFPPRGFEYVSPAVTSIIGYTPEEHYADPDIACKLVHPDDYALLQQYLIRMCTDPFTLRFMHKDGHLLWLEQRNVWIIDGDGHTIAIEGVARDLTGHRQAPEDEARQRGTEGFSDVERLLSQSRGPDQAATAIENGRLYQELQRAYAKLAHTQEQLMQAQKMEAVGRLAGGIAHDFNNLLTVILGRAELVLNRLRNRPRLRRHLELILNAVDSASSLTRQLLAFSRRQELQPTVIDVNAIVVNVSAMLRWLIGEDIRVNLHLAPGLWPVKADAGQIEQVLMHLAVHARDALPRGGHLSIETVNIVLDEADTQAHIGVQPGSYVRVTVSETKSGLDTSKLNHVLETFFPPKDSGQGAGLGLSTVHRVITQNGGHMTVDGAVGRGTSFIIYLPQTSDLEEPVTLTLPEMDPPRGAETILLVEDEAMVRGLSREVLQMLGYNVIEASNGDEALRYCLEHAGPIHLLVTDVVMPGMSGPDLARHLAEGYPALCVLYLSGYADEALMHHGVIGSSAALLHKPFTPEALARRVRDILDQQPRDASPSARQRRKRVQ